MDVDRLETVETVSAGGVVFRSIDGIDQIAIVKIVPEMRWQLPKGLVDPGESIEAAALREVREEAGVDAEIIRPLNDIEYSFIAAYDGVRRRYHKVVHFFLMRYLSGSVDDHDDEVAEATWAEPAEALTKLVFENERGVVEDSIGMLRELAN